MASKGKKIFVAMSGGVDSSVAAALLKKAGFQVVGVFMKQWSAGENDLDCLWKEEREYALRTAARLDIPLLTWDFSKEYQKHVADYMVQGYKKGITPNPDVMCNKIIKFGLFLDKALKLGADYIATGHYVQLEIQTPRGSNSARSFSSRPARDSDSDSATSRKRLGGTFDEKVVGRFASPSAGGSDQAKTTSESARRTTPARLSYYKLLKAKDKNKDQSYFLYSLTQKQLKHCLFPIGDYTKDEVRRMAKSFGFPNWDKKDSQGVCFVGPIHFDEFLKDRIKPQKGLIIRKSDGEILGEHDGAWYYTIGQRHGFNLSVGRPYYITDKDVKSNILYVDDNFGLNQKLEIKNFNWISKKDLPFNCKVKTRYRQKDLDCSISKNGSDRVMVKIKESNIPIVPGQAAVFYKGREVVGGGIIVK